jgi:hypothetical protein
MRRTRSLGIGLLAVAGLGLLVALFAALFGGLGGGRGRDASAPRIDGDAVGAELARAPVAGEAARREAPGAEAEAELRPETRPASAPRAPAEAALVLAFDGRVLDEEERPLPGAEVRLLDGRVLARAAEDGRVEATVELAPAERLLDGAGRLRKLVLEVGAPGFACEHVVVQVEPGVSLHLGTVRLGRGGEVRGRVLGADGKPLAAGVSWRHADERPHDEENVAAARKVGVRKQRAPPWREFESDAEGRFHLRGLPEGEVFLVAWAEGHARGWSETFVVRPGTITELDVTLPPGERPLLRVHGRVLDPARRPAAGVKVTVVQGWLGGFVDVSDAEGAFEGTLALVPDGGLLRVEALDPEQRGYPVELDELEPSSLAQALELVLERPRFLEVRLVDAGGEPVPWGHVRFSGDRTDPALPWELVPAGREGRARVLWPRVRFTLEAMAPGFATARTETLEPAAVTSPLVVTLHPGEAVSGRVVAHGRPVGGARVALQRTFDPESRGRSTTLTVGETPFVLHGVTPAERADATTDASGRFTLTLHADDWHALVVAAEGFPLTPFGPWKLERARGLAGAELELRAAGAIEGHVLVPPGRTREGRLVGASNGWAVAHTASTDAEGFFRIEGLVPGHYQVRECVPPARSVEPIRSFGDTQLEQEWDCEVRPDATTRFDLDRRGEEDFVLEGRLALPPGSTGWTAEASRDGEVGLCLAPVHLGVDGTFRFALGRGGNLHLSIAGDLGTFHATAQLAPGLNPWKLDPGWAELNLVGLDALGEYEYLNLGRMDPVGTTFEREVARKQRDRERILVPAGVLRIQRVQFDTLQEEFDVEVRAGVETTFDLRKALQR